MSNNSNALWDKLVTPVIIMVLGFLATWVFSINSDMAVIKQSMNRVDSVISEQRNMEKMIVLLEAQNKNNADLAVEVKNGQQKMNDAIVELRISLTKLSSMLPEQPERVESRTHR
ncbi:hypothetical protein D3C76_447610 [compost metagenome]